jgi:MORN repeat
VFLWPSGAIFEGTWINGLKEGKGKYKSPKGKVLDGVWKNNKVIELVEE